MIKIYTKISRPNAKLKLVCLHHVGGSAPMYLNWSHAIPENIELSSIQLPGRGDLFKHEIIDNIAIASQEVATLLNTEIHLPYILFGHSLGALLAYETICYLQKNKMPLPIHFIASGLSAPHKLKSLVRRHLLSNEELIQLLASYDKGRVEQSKVYFDLLELLLPAVRGDFKMHDDYSYQQSELMTCPVTAVAGDQDGFHVEENIRGWSELTTNKFTYTLLPGGHMYLFDDQKVFLEWLNATLLKISL
jgi:surfactin synthase thioesterase subunit